MVPREDLIHRATIFERCSVAAKDVSVGKSMLSAKIIYRPIKGVLHPWALFLKISCIFSKNKQLSTKFPMDLVRHFPRNSKSTVLLQ